MNTWEAYTLRKLAGRIALAGKPTRYVWALFLVAILAVVLGGCGTSVTIPTTSAAGPRLYMTPVIYGGTSGKSSYYPTTLSIDDAALTFAQQTYAFSDAQSGMQVNYSGNLKSFSRNLLELELTYSCGTTTTSGCSGITYDPPKIGWAVELANQSGGLAQLSGQSFVPLLPAVTCPSMSSAESFLFVTLPARLITIGTGQNTWNPLNETAYGSVDISTSGSTVTLANITQNILPSASARGGTLTNASSSSSVTGACSSTVYGNTVAIPANSTITIDSTGTETVTPQAMLGIGSTGLLVEDNGTSGHSTAPYYENDLGAGTGAIGLPKPSSAVDTSALIGAQYLGFFYGSGSSGSTTNWSSSMASFGFSSQPTTCAAVATSTSTMLYGGDFSSNNPAASTGGYGNCDFAIDLGPEGGQDGKTNGLYSSAMVYVGAGFCPNRGATTCTPVAQSYHFPAVAIAGQLDGKFAIFLIGEDTAGSPNQAWGVYLLQSN
jgi:hypothetical protein